MSYEQKHIRKKKVPATELFLSSGIVVINVPKLATNHQQRS